MFRLSFKRLSQFYKNKKKGRECHVFNYQEEAGGGPRKSLFVRPHYWPNKFNCFNMALYTLLLFCTLKFFVFKNNYIIRDGKRSIKKKFVKSECVFLEQPVFPCLLIVYLKIVDYTIEPFICTFTCILNTKRGQKIKIKI